MEVEVEGGGRGGRSKIEGRRSTSNAELSHAEHSLLKVEEVMGSESLAHCTYEVTNEYRGRTACPPPIALIAVRTDVVRRERPERQRRRLLVSMPTAAGIPTARPITTAPIPTARR